MDNDNENKHQGVDLVICIKFINSAQFKKSKHLLIKMQSYKPVSAIALFFQFL